MDIALMLRHGLRDNAPNEAMAHPHLELVASNEKERERLEVLARQLKAFGSVPFQFHPLESADARLTGAVMRIALCQRELEPGDGAKQG
jgi:hypothetical protein